MFSIRRILSRIFCRTMKAWKFGDYFLTKDYLIGPGEPNHRLVLRLDKFVQVILVIGSDHDIHIVSKEGNYYLDIGDDCLAFLQAVRSIAPHVSWGRSYALTGEVDLFF